MGIMTAQEKISFTSANPFSFKDIITDLEGQTPHEIHGFLRLPETTQEGPYPLIIGVAGSLDWAEQHFEYLEMYRQMGIATFEMQSFGSRGISSTVGTQVDVTTGMIVLDVYRAFEKLAKDPRIDKDRVGITGWSLGGAVTLFSGWIPLKEKINTDLEFAAHLAFYPPCFIEPDLLTFTNAPMHILIGEIDNWTPAAACEELVPKMQMAGTNIDLTVYPDSHHSFDRRTPPEVMADGYSFTDCRFKMRPDGAVLMNFLNIPMTSPTLQKIGLSFCADRGPTLGGNPASREAAFKFAKEFMGQHLLGTKGEN